MDSSIDREAIIAALRGALTPFHYQWLCACAVYPGLRFPLTVWLGARLAEREGREPPDADAHLPLIRLPWFRDGAIPDAMRLRLLRDLTPENRDFVRCDIEALFAAARPSGDDPDALILYPFTPLPPGSWGAKPPWTLRNRFLRQ